MSRVKRFIAEHKACSAVKLGNFLQDDQLISVKVSFINVTRH